MTSQSLLGFLPLIIMMVSVLLVMFAASFKCSHKSIAILSAVGLLSALASTFLTYGKETLEVTTPLLIVDPYGLYMMQLILILSFIIVIFSYEYWRKFNTRAHEYYISLLLSITGALVMVISDHLASFFLGLELMTIPLYAAISYFSTRKSSLDAGVKYIILAGTSTALLLFGMALIYAQSGTMNLITMGEKLNSGLSVAEPLFLGGFALMLVGVGFKISAVPFHLWTPDVYDGAPLPVAAYLATISKGASIALFFRLWQVVAPGAPDAAWIIACMAGLSMVGGNLLALKQDNLKRLLGYSSIAHFGYILMTILSFGSTASEAFLFYLSAYGATILLVFGALICLSSANKEIVMISDLHGLMKTKRALALVLTLGFFSLMGIPFTAIFMGKILVIMAGVESSQWFLLTSLLLSSIVGLFVYLRLVNALFVQGENSDITLQLTPWASSALALLSVIAMLLGIWPTLATDLMPLAHDGMFHSE